MREKILSGYVLVDMVPTDDAWSVVRNTPQVTGFVGTANQAVPLSKEEVDSIFARMSDDHVKHTIDLGVDDAVLIIDGPFKDLEGKVGRLTKSEERLR